MIINPSANNSALNGLSQNSSTTINNTIIGSSISTNANNQQHGSSTTNNNNTATTEDLTSLEAEISELHRASARVETQMMRLKSDINAMESHLTHGDRVRNFRLVERYRKKFVFQFNIVLYIPIFICRC